MGGAEVRGSHAEVGDIADGAGLKLVAGIVERFHHGRNGEVASVANDLDGIAPVGRDLAVEDGEPGEVGGIGSSPGVAELLAFVVAEMGEEGRVFFRDGVGAGALDDEHVDVRLHGGVGRDVGAGRGHPVSGIGDDSGFGLDGGEVDLVAVLLHAEGLAGFPGEAARFFSRDAGPGQSEGEHDEGGLEAHAGRGLFGEPVAAVAEGAEDGSEG